MIKTLQRKFIVTAMIAITILIVSVLGIVNVANAVLIHRNVEQRIKMLSQYEGDPDNLPGPFNSKRKEAIMQPKDDRDKMLSSNYFLVRYDSMGNTVFVDTRHTATVTSDEAAQLAASVYNGEEADGNTGKYKYKIAKSIFNEDYTVVFLDTTDEKYSYIRVIGLSLSAGFACWLIMLLIVTLLSKKAIKPIAENMEKQKQFITNAGHEIKTPLAIIQANTDAMELYNGETKWSNNIKIQVARLDGLMKNMLTLAKMDEGQKFTPVNFSLTELMENCYQAFIEPFKLKNIEVTASIKENILIHAEKEQITQLISILLDNALKYTNENGTLNINLSHSGKKAIIEITNTCESLPDVEAEKLFDRFYRADKARSQKNGGYGIGLSVAKSIVEANHGSIHAQYSEPNTISFIVKI